jgi:hypothetical protein
VPGPTGGGVSGRLAHHDGSSVNESNDTEGD